MDDSSFYHCVVYLDDPEISATSYQQLEFAHFSQRWFIYHVTEVLN